MRACVKIDLKAVSTVQHSTGGGGGGGGGEVREGWSQGLRVSISKHRRQGD